MMEPIFHDNDRLPTCPECKDDLVLFGDEDCVGGPIRSMAQLRGAFSYARPGDVIRFGQCRCGMQLEVVIPEPKAMHVQADTAKADDVTAIAVVDHKTVARPYSTRGAHDHLDIEWIPVPDEKRLMEFQSWHDFLVEMMTSVFNAFAPPSMPFPQIEFKKGVEPVPILVDTTRTLTKEELANIINGVPPEPGSQGRAADYGPSLISQVWPTLAAVDRFKQLSAGPNMQNYPMTPHETSQKEATDVYYRSTLPHESGYDPHTPAWKIAQIDDNGRVLWPGYRRLHEGETLQNGDVFEQPQGFVGPGPMQYALSAPFDAESPWPGQPVNSMRRALRPFGVPAEADRQAAKRPQYQPIEVTATISYGKTKITPREHETLNGEPMSGLAHVPGFEHPRTAALRIAHGRNEACCHTEQWGEEFEIW